MRERLHRMRDYHDRYLRCGYVEVSPLMDPWHEAHPGALVQRIEETELRMQTERECASQISRQMHQVMTKSLKHKGEDKVDSESSSWAAPAVSKANPRKPQAQSAVAGGRRSPMRAKASSCVAAPKSGFKAGPVAPTRGSDVDKAAGSSPRQSPRKGSTSRRQTISVVPKKAPIVPLKPRKDSQRGAVSPPHPCHRPGVADLEISFGKEQPQRRPSPDPSQGRPVNTPATEAPLSPRNFAVPPEVLVPNAEMRASPSRRSSPKQEAGRSPAELARRAPQISSSGTTNSPSDLSMAAAAFEEVRAVATENEQLRKELEQAWHLCYALREKVIMQESDKNLNTTQARLLRHQIV